MGKGDRRSKRGKIFRGTFGKRRPKPEEERKKAKAAAQPRHRPSCGRGGSARDRPGSRDWAAIASGPDAIV